MGAIINKTYWAHFCVIEHRRRKTMSQPRTVAVVVGSLRKDSVSRKIARALEALTPELKFVEVEIGALPHFDQDLEANPPAEWVAFRE
jgi:chromate reductase